MQDQTDFSDPVMESLKWKPVRHLDGIVMTVSYSQPLFKLLRAHEQKKAPTPTGH